MTKKEKLLTSHTSLVGSGKLYHIHMFQFALVLGWALVCTARPINVYKENVFSENGLLTETINLTS